MPITGPPNSEAKRQLSSTGVTGSKLTELLARPPEQRDSSSANASLRCYLEGLPLELINDPSDLSKKEGPGIDEVNPVHHDGNDAVPALEAPGQAVFNEEGMAEHKTVLLIPKEDGPFTARAHLGGNHNNSKDSSLLASVTPGHKFPTTSFFPVPGMEPKALCMLSQLHSPQSYTSRHSSELCWHTSASNTHRENGRTQ